MNKRFLLSVAIVLLVSSAICCRSRRRVPHPQTAPLPAATHSETVVSVPSPGRDFPMTETTDRDLSTSDIAEVNQIAHDRGWIRDAFFDFDASTLDADAQEALRQSATWLRSRREYGVRIEGQCDERGTEQYNLALGERRASSAATYLEVLGISRERISTISYGEGRPFDTASNEAAWAQNRRDHLVLIKLR